MPEVLHLWSLTAPTCVTLTTLYYLVDVRVRGGECCREAALEACCFARAKCGRACISGPQETYVCACTCTQGMPRRHTKSETGDVHHSRLAGRFAVVEGVFQVIHLPINLVLLLSFLHLLVGKMMTHLSYHGI